MSAIEPPVGGLGNSYISTVWITGVLLRVTMVFALFALLAWEPDYPALYIAAILLDVIVFSWQATRIFGQTRAYGLKTGRFLTVLGVYFTTILVGLFTAYMWLMTFASLERSMSEREFDMPDKTNGLGTRTVAKSKAPQRRYRVEISLDRRTLYMEGIMVAGMMSELDQVLAQSPAMETIVLDSPGGDLFEARKFAQSIQQYNLNTLVLVECSASCLIPFMAGGSRTLGPGGKLGFHRYGLDFKQLKPYLDTSSEVIKDKAFFESRAVTATFLQQYLSQDRSALWYPRRSYLFDSGVTTQN